MTCPSCQLAVDTHTTDQLRRCVLAKAAVPVSMRCPYLFHTGSKCRLIVNHHGEHKSWEGLREPVGGPQPRGGVIREVEYLPDNRTAIHLTDGRTIYTRSAPMPEHPFEERPDAPIAPSPAPFVVTMPVEPGVGTVLVYQRRLPGRSGGPDRTYHYASIRAGNGLWYTTGQEARQGVGWHELCEVLASVGEVHTPTAWAPFGPFTS